MRLIIDERHLREEAIAWWKSLDPGTRGVFMQALHEVEGEPEPRSRKNAALRKARGKEQ